MKREIEFRSLSAFSSRRAPRSAKTLISQGIGDVLSKQEFRTPQSVGKHPIMGSDRRVRQTGNACKSVGGYAGETPASVLFRQLTDYLVSRDIAGYVGRNYRCKTVAEVRAMKDQIAGVAAKKVQAAEVQQKLASKTWLEAYPLILKRLQQP